MQKRANLKVSARPAATPASAPLDKTRLLNLSVRPGQTESEALAEIVTRGTVGCSSTVIDYAKNYHEGLSLTDMARALKIQGEAVNRGDLSEAERMLNGQAVALNAIFNELARRAANNMGTYLGTTETYLRLALKAQAQSRATVEALAEMKNPHSVAFVKQANIAHGNQQVNNGSATEQAEGRTHRPRAHAHAGNLPTEPSKLLEATDVKRLDTGAQSSASGTHQGVAALGFLHGT